MRDPQKFIRKAIIERLQGNIMTEAGNVQGFQWKDVLLIGALMLINTTK